jgi:hypothetical protein
MNAPKRWLDTESSANDFERALLQPALQIDIPAGVEQQIWLGLAGSVASASVAVATATAKAGTAEAATLASSAGGGTVGAGAAKLAVAALIKSFAIGASAGALLAGGYSTLASKHSEPGSQRAASQTSIVTKTPSEMSAPGVPRSPVSPVVTPSAPPPLARQAEHGAAREASSVPSALPAVAAFDVQQAPQNAKPAERASRLREEARVLRDAREALRRGDLAGAFAALEVARTEFAAGMLGEEREALTIELLAKSGQRETARQRARAFLRSFPRSAHADRVRSFAE